MSVTVDLPDEVMARLQAAAEARGVTVEQLAADMLALVPPVDGDFAAVVADTIAEHQEILDRLAET